MEAEGDNDWEFLSEWKDRNLKCESSGYLVHETPEYIVVAAHIAEGRSEEDVQFTGYVVIPRVAILEIKPHKEPRKKKVKKSATPSGTTETKGSS
ncbi:MAG: hypothetical protein MN733_32150 [Nitrososphaera sp.]|nr:hypothetical protein [Nitrososphaera sp.]